MMTVLNGLVMDALIWHELPAISIAPSSCFITENGKVKFFDETILKAYAKNDIYTQSFYGDVVLDEKIGFHSSLRRPTRRIPRHQIQSPKIVVGTDTDGLFDSDPKTNPDAKPFKKLNLKELKELQPKLGKAQGTDVTGGMAGKIAELSPQSKQASCNHHRRHKRVIYLQSLNRPECLRH
jgi:isopentenyl phosphate kinase